ncbi:ATP-binding protein [Actinocorallia longicatena]|uniref:Histidine kinase/HSP90-like ATPase domain-containing protein n=1 Tax=Actinocorallia longicatena TaxID=111803 RepID=A0ABP6QMJ9_9ACTN
MTTGRLLGSVTLPGTAENVGETRRFAGRLLSEGETADTVVLLVSEAVTNSVVHSRSGSGGMVTLSLIDLGGDVLRVEVVDDGAATVPTPRRSDTTSLGGRGLELIQDLTERSGWDPIGSDALCTWFELPASTPWRT